MRICFIEHNKMTLLISMLSLYTYSAGNLFKAIGHSYATLAN